MIQNYVPRNFGLDAVINDVLSSDTPLRTLTEKHIFIPADLLKIRVNSFETVDEMIRTLRAGGNSEIASLPVVPRVALEHVARGQEYLMADEESLREAFPFGGQEYYFVDASSNRYNDSFTLALFPRETITIGEKRSMLETFTYPPRFNPEKYEHIKSLVFKVGDSYIMVVVKGEERADLINIADMLHVRKKDLQMAQLEEVSQLTGREVGAVSPLLYEPCFRNMMAIYFSRNLLEDSYSKPHYELMLDKRSALVVSDLRDVLGILKGVPNYPQIFQFVNGDSSAGSK